MEEECEETDAVPVDDPASLFVPSDLIEVEVRREEKYVAINALPDEGPANLLGPSNLEVL